MELDFIEVIKNVVQFGFGVVFVLVFVILKELELGVLYWVKIEGINIICDLLVLINLKCYLDVVISMFR